MAPIANDQKVPEFLGAIIVRFFSCRSFVEQCDKCEVVLLSYNPERKKEDL